MFCLLTIIKSDAMKSRLDLLIRTQSYETMWNKMKMKIKCVALLLRESNKNSQQLPVLLQP